MLRQDGQAGARCVEGVGSSGVAVPPGAVRAGRQSDVQCVYAGTDGKSASNPQKTKRRTFWPTNREAFSFSFFCSGYRSGAVRVSPTPPCDRSNAREEKLKNRIGVNFG